MGLGRCLQGAVYASGHDPGRQNSQIQEIKQEVALSPSFLVTYLERLCFLFLQLWFFPKDCGSWSTWEEHLYNLVRASLNLKLCLSPSPLKLLHQYTISSTPPKKDFMYWLEWLILIISRKQASFYTVRTGRSVSGIQWTVWSPALDAPRPWMGSSSNHTLTRTRELGVQTPQGQGYDLSHQVHNLNQQKDWLRVRGTQSEVRG